MADRAGNYGQGWQTFAGNIIPPSSERTVMSDEKQNALIVRNPWQSLRDFTLARIALGRTGTSLPVGETLDFRMAHARARDAVYSLLDVSMLEEKLALHNLPLVILHS